MIRSYRERRPTRSEDARMGCRCTLPGRVMPTQGRGSPGPSVVGLGGCQQEETALPQSFSGMQRPAGRCCPPQ